MFGVVDGDFVPVLSVEVDLGGSDRSHVWADGGKQRAEGAVGPRAIPGYTTCGARHASISCRHEDRDSAQCELHPLVTLPLHIMLTKGPLVNAIGYRDDVVRLVDATLPLALVKTFGYPSVWEQVVVIGIVRVESRVISAVVGTIGCVDGVEKVVAQSDVVARGRVVDEIQIDRLGIDNGKCHRHVQDHLSNSFFTRFAIVVDALDRGTGAAVDEGCELSPERVEIGLGEVVLGAVDAEGVVWRSLVLERDAI